jgi:DNA-binding CsgD family transcriptional regulator
VNHRHIRDGEPATTIDEIDDAARSRMIDLMQARAMPSFMIFDAAGELASCSPDLAAGALLPVYRRVVAERIARDGGLHAQPAFEVVDRGTMLRVVALLGERTGFAVFVEPLSERDPLPAAASRYRMTARETAVLRLLIDGKSTAQIAETLGIVDGTVGDHVQNLFRKTATNKRSELVACVLRDQFDEAGPPIG